MEDVIGFLMCIFLPSWVEPMKKAEGKDEGKARLQKMSSEMKDKEKYTEGRGKRHMKEKMKKG